MSTTNSTISYRDRWTIRALTVARTGGMGPLNPALLSIGVLGIWRVLLQDKRAGQDCRLSDGQLLEAALLLA